MSANNPNVQSAQAAQNKKSTFIALGTIGAVAASVLACCCLSTEEEEVIADCVDRNDYVSGSGYRIVDDDECDDSDSYGSYFWYYGGTRTGLRSYGGSSFKPKDVKIKTRSGKTLQKGGFGSRFSGSGG
ncbi:MAG: hypothetical protein HOQ05_06340 [Corynebacteriales bacterium]|nr:hypothetical protein [Mycobacteriales bacterium]